MSDENRLSPEELEALREVVAQAPDILSMAERFRLKMQSAGTIGATVTKHPEWTERDAQMHGRENDLASAQRAHANSIARLERAEVELERTLGDVAAVTKRLEEFVTETEAEASELQVLTEDDVGEAPPEVLEG